MLHSHFSQKTKYLVSKAFIVFAFVLSSFALAPEAKAGAWGESIFAMLTDNVLDTITRQIEGAFLGTLKVTAIQTLNNQVAQLAGGATGSQALFVTDWNEFLYETPKQNTDLFMNDFYTLSTRGKFSSANYISAGSSSGVSGNYVSYLVDQAKSSVSPSQTLSYNLDQYASDPDALFSEGDWRGFNALFSNPYNNPYGYSLAAEQAYVSKLAQEEESAKIKAQSSGFLGLEKNGVVTTPAGSIQAMVTDVQTLGNKVIANAQNPAEFLSGVVQAVVNATVTRVVQTGLGKVETNLRREMYGINNQINTAINQGYNTLGPAASFTSSLNQRTNVNINVKTPAPPSALGSGI